MKKLLTLKHWQIFMILIGLPVILQIVGMIAMISGKNRTIALLSFPIMLLLFIAIFFGWFYALATSLNKRLPDTVRMNLTKFKWFLFIPVAYMLILSVFMVGLFTNMSNPHQPPIQIFALVVPLHLFSMFCIFYCLYFTAKSLKAVELQRPVSFGDYAGEFFLLWFFPVGVWIIQPRVNKMFVSSPDDGKDSTT
jgi:hypothetical protein